MNIHVWLAGFYTAIILFQIVAIPALILRKNDLADVLWGPAFAISAFSAAYFSRPERLSNLDLRNLILFILISAWGLRLFLHVGLRNLSHLQEDVRYNNWRKQWGKNWLWRSYLQVFVLQALILFVFLSPVLHSLASPSKGMTAVSWLGLLLWILGFSFEWIADEQLRKFKSNTENKGKIITKGLWSLSRHPNYFGEVTLWWGIWLMVLDLPNGYWTLISPLGVTYLILKVSGVDMLEDLMKNRPGFSEYAKTTSKFFPWKKR